MARFNVITLINPSDKDYVDMYDGDEYIVPAHGELQVPDFIAYHWVGDPENPADIKRILERRGDGGKNPVGVAIQIKQQTEGPDKEFIVEGNKPILMVKKTASKK